MNWKLIFALSLFGLAMAFATVYVIPFNIEWIFWVVIALVCAYIIAKQAPGKYFLHGFCVSLVNCVWITGVHYFLFDTYLQHHPDMVVTDPAKIMTGSQRTDALVFGPVIGIISGLVQGLFAWIASKIVKK